MTRCLSGRSRAWIGPAPARRPPSNRVPSPPWKSYFWPGTSVLRNKLGITEQTALSVMERAHTLRQAQRIATGRLPTERTFDDSHLQAIHSALFSAMYDSAGQFRTVDIRRGVNEFARVNDIPALLGQMHRRVPETDWSVDDPDVFASNIADTFVIVNFAHPFRDGNGRTTRIFLNHVAELRPFGSISRR